MRLQTNSQGLHAGEIYTNCTHRSSLMGATLKYNSITINSIWNTAYYKYTNSDHKIILLLSPNLLFIDNISFKGSVYKSCIITYRLVENLVTFKSDGKIWLGVDLRTSKISCPLDL